MCSLDIKGAVKKMKSDCKLYFYEVGCDDCPWFQSVCDFASKGYPMDIEDEDIETLKDLI